MAYVEAPQFGVEIELLVRPKPALLEFMSQYGYEESTEYFQARKNRRALHRALAEALSVGGLAAKVDEDEGEFSTWLVAYDGSIQESDGFYGLEVISRLLESADNWLAEIDLLWTLLDDFCFIRSDDSCGTHVHTSLRGRYTLDELKRIAKATVYYEPAITSVMPNERKVSLWSRSNMSESTQLRQAYDNAQIHGYGYLFDWIDSFEDEEALSNAISPTKAVSWNFKNAVPGGCGTVEFRRPPQVTSTEATKHWIAFTLCLVTYSVHCDFSQISQLTGKPSTENLRNAISWAANRLGSPLAALKPLNDIAATAHSIQPNAQEVARIMELKKQKKSVFAEKLQSAQSSLAASAAQLASGSSATAAKN
ncbi:MAG: hypothetical protein M1840_008514 [Geoglossum simile]|nr:MAG: hypothetical protein M1840_008514 [Geoglossum simile]